MPLPDGGNTPWPPAHCEAINQQYATWAAWWRGDVEQLAAVYGGGQAADTTGFFASQTGGFKVNARKVVGLVRRWFWGTRTASTQQRSRLHVPLAGDIPETSAGMLFGEPLTVTVDPLTPAADGKPETADQATLDVLAEILDDGAYARLLEAAEICAAYGGVYLRIVWDPAVSSLPWFTAHSPDLAIPEWRWGSLAAVTFWREVARDGRDVYRHLERHEPGAILHGLYRGTVDELGMPVPLTDQPATARLANEQLVNGNEVKTGTDKLTVVYVPNVKPNRVWQHNPDAVHLGRPDIAGAEPLLDALDLTWSSWIRDVDLGKARLVVPQEYMQTLGPGQGATVDLDQEVYEPVGVMGSENGDKLQIEQVQFKIRVAEHQQTVDAIKGAIVDSAGYSGETFGLKGDTAMTATEVDDRKHKSSVTRDRKIRYWRPALADLLEVLLEVAVALLHAQVRAQRPDVEFSPTVSEDPKALAEELQLLHQAEAISIEQKVRRQHPDWDDTQVDEEVEQIREDYNLAAAADAQAALEGLAGTGPGGQPGQPPEPPVPPQGG